MRAVALAVSTSVSCVSVEARAGKPRKRREGEVCGHGCGIVRVWRGRRALWICKHVVVASGSRRDMFARNMVIDAKNTEKMWMRSGANDS